VKANIFRGVNVEFNAPTLGSAVALICDGDTVEAFSTDADLAAVLQRVADNSSRIAQAKAESDDTFDACLDLAGTMPYTLFGEYEPYSKKAAAEVREFFK
jgi:hypothetical protein